MKIYGIFFQIEAIISEKYVVTPNFLFGFQYLLPISFLPSQKLPKNAFELYSDHPEICRTYAQEQNEALSIIKFSIIMITNSNYL